MPDIDRLVRSGDIPDIKSIKGFARLPVGNPFGRAMAEIRRPEVYARCLRQVGILRRLLSPERNAMRYLIGLR